MKLIKLQNLEFGPLPCTKHVMEIELIPKTKLSTCKILLDAHGMMEIY